MTQSPTITYRTSLEVRGYELDSYGHVNHAVYISYLEHARWKLLEQEGITREKFASWKTWPVVAALEVKYIRPLYMGQTVEIETQIVESGRVYFTCSQTILFEGKPVFVGKVRIALVNEQGRPTQAPEGLMPLLGFSGTGP